MASTHLDNLVSAMSRNDFYPHPTENIEKRETHISIVFLTGEFVYKIKKPLDLQFLDFTDLEKRARFCRAEVTLNQRLSSRIYLDVVPITLSSKGYALDGEGKVVEYAVKMVQLSDQDRLDKRLRKGGINSDEIERLAQKLAHFYAQASSGPQIAAMGAWEVVWKNCEENFEQIKALELSSGEKKKERLMATFSR